MCKLVIFSSIFLASCFAHNEGKITDEMLLSELNRIISMSIQDFMSQFDPNIDNTWFEAFIHERDNCWFNCKNPICTDNRIREVVMWRCIAMRTMFPDDWEKRL